MHTLSASGERLIKNFEGLRLKPYKDSANKWTIGYGHLLTGKDFLNLPIWLLKGITQQEADVFFINDIAGPCFQLNKLITVPITQNQFDALASFTYNLGVGALTGGSVLTLINKRSYVAAAQKMVLYDKVVVNGIATKNPGLSMRRRLEAKLFLKP